MLETLKSTAFVIAAVMIALVLQAQAGSFTPDETRSDDSAPYEQIEVYN